MTAQCVVMNGHGVAIASDSAVSLGTTRTYETAEKIYPLSLPHRLAVLHGGAVNFGGIPFPVLIAEWTRQLSTKALRDANAYMANFIDWLEHHDEWFSSERELNSFRWFAEDRVKRLHELYQESKQSEDEFVFQSYMDTWIVDCKESGTWDGLQVEDVKELVTDIQDEIEEMINAFPELSPIIEPRELFFDYLAICYASKILQGTDYVSVAGLVFAGYGENDILPSYVSVEIAGILNKKVARENAFSFSLKTDQPQMFSLYLPAQRDAIDLFLRGYDYGFIERLAQSQERNLEVVINQVKESGIDGTEQIITLLEDLKTNSEESLLAAARDASEDAYLRDLRRSLASVPLGTLAEISKSLVEIQSLRQTTNAQFNSVGGPTDVGIINPLNGFQWIYHKSI